MMGKSEAAEVLLRSCTAALDVILRRGDERVGDTEGKAGLR